MRRREIGMKDTAMVACNAVIERGARSRIRRAGAQKVADLMTHKVITANPETSIGDIASSN